MRIPRVSFTIARLMVLILVVGLTIAIVFEISARRKYQRSKLVREVAESALKEYEEGVYLQDRATYQGLIKLSESNLEQATDRLDWTTRMKAKGLVTPESQIAAELTKQQAEFDLEQARTQLEVLEKYTRDKQRKSLIMNIEKARSEEQARLHECQTERIRRSWWGVGD